MSDKSDYGSRERIQQATKVDELFESGLANEKRFVGVKGDWLGSERQRQEGVTSGNGGGTVLPSTCLLSESLYEGVVIGLRRRTAGSELG